MRLFQIVNGAVSIIKDNQYYSDTVENYILDGGIIKKDDERMNIVVHDDQQNYCEVNGEVLEYPVEFFENIIDGIDELLAKKAEREYVEPVPPTEEELQQYFEDSVEAYMTSVVQTRNYRDIHTAASYVNSTNEKFAREGAACNKWRDDVWAKCYAILAEVKAGTRPIPTLEEVIAELPVLDW